MTDRHTFPKSERLCGEKTIAKLFKEGASGFVYPFKYVYLCEQDSQQQAKIDSGELLAGEPRVAVLVSVSKRYHKRANKRNLNKRRIREAYRLNKGILTECSANSRKSVNLALIYVTKERLEYKTVENAIQKILATVASRL